MYCTYCKQKEIMQLQIKMDLHRDRVQGITPATLILAFSDFETLTILLIQFVGIYIVATFKY